MLNLFIIKPESVFFWGGGKQIIYCSSSAVSAAPLNLHITWLTHLAVAQEDMTRSLHMICSHSCLLLKHGKLCNLLDRGIYFKSLSHSKIKSDDRQTGDHQSKPVKAIVCACECRPASISSLSGGQMSWASSGREKPRESIQSQFCYQRCSREIRHTTKHPRTAADALHWENEVGAAANSLNQHNAYITDTGYRQSPAVLQWKPPNTRENPVGVQTPRLPKYQQKVG